MHCSFLFVQYSPIPPSLVPPPSAYTPTPCTKAFCQMASASFVSLASQRGKKTARATQGCLRAGLRAPVNGFNTRHASLYTGACSSLSPQLLQIYSCGNVFRSSRDGGDFLRRSLDLGCQGRYTIGTCFVYQVPVTATTPVMCFPRVLKKKVNKKIHYHCIKLPHLLELNYLNFFHKN